MIFGTSRFPHRDAALIFVWGGASKHTHIFTSFLQQSSNQPQLFSDQINLFESNGMEHEK